MSRARVLVALAALFVFVGGTVALARAVADVATSPWGILASVPGAVLAILAIGSLYEWVVHRNLYHRASRVALFQGIHEVHQRGHHWHRFPPDRYVEPGPVERIPVWPPAPYRLCGSRARRVVAWTGQFALYLAVGVPLAFVPAWLLTGNWLFTASATVSGLAVCYLFIHVHDVIHYPAGRWIERQRWFRFLDRHHYLHHIDPRTNVNFLLPLCDWLFGTLKLETTAAERARWPSFEEAKRLDRPPDAEGLLAAGAS
jgi:hypothetical protein